MKATFAPAFDIVPHTISQGIQGHALHLVHKGPSKPGEGSRKLLLFTPAKVREFAALVGIQEFRIGKTVEETCVLAVERWPAVISASGLPQPWIKKLMERVEDQSLIRSSIKRSLKARSVARI